MKRNIIIISVCFLILIIFLSLFNVILNEQKTIDNKIDKLISKK